MREVYVQYDSNEKCLDHDYDIEIENNLTILRYSNNSSWNDDHRGKVCGSLIDNGNAVSIQLRFMESIELDYSQLSELMALLLSNADYKMEIRESKIIKSI